MARRPSFVRLSVCPSVCKLLRKSLLLAGKWLDRHQTCTRWTPGQHASRVCSRSRSRSKVTWNAHFFGFLEWATPSLTVWFDTLWGQRLESTDLPVDIVAGRAHWWAERMKIKLQQQRWQRRQRRRARQHCRLWLSLHGLADDDRPTDWTDQTRVTLDAAVTASTSAARSMATNQRRLSISWDTGDTDTLQATDINLLVCRVSCRLAAGACWCRLDDRRSGSTRRYSA